MDVKFKKTHPDAVVPFYATPGSAAFDIATPNSTGDFGIYKDYGTYATIELNTKLEFEIPYNHVMLIYSRSGHGFKHGIKLDNGTGIIDSDYRGELKIKLVAPARSIPDLIQLLKPNTRVAQGIILPYPEIKFIETDILSSTDRGTGGFGSTDNFIK